MGSKLGIKPREDEKEPIAGFLFLSRVASHVIERPELCGGIVKSLREGPLFHRTNTGGRPFAVDLACIFLLI